MGVAYQKEKHRREDLAADNHETKAKVNGINRRPAGRSCELAGAAAVESGEGRAAGVCLKYQAVLNGEKVSMTWRIK